MKKWLVLFVLLITCISVSAETLDGKVTKVIDGDTIWIDAKYKVRLKWIDAPELKQKYGPEAGKFMSDLVLGKNVNIVTISKDIYQRTLGVVMLGNTNINKLMVSEGWAWNYQGYSIAEINKLQEAARFSKVGIWKTETETSCKPWDFRKKKCQ